MLVFLRRKSEDIRFRRDGARLFYLALESVAERPHVLDGKYEHDGIVWMVDGGDVQSALGGLLPVVRKKSQ